MRNFRKVLLAVFGLLIVLALLTFVLENQQSVSLVFFGWVGPEFPVSLVLVIALLTGMLLGPIVGWIMGRRMRASRKRLV